MKTETLLAVVLLLAAGACRSSEIDEKRGPPNCQVHKRCPPGTVCNLITGVCIELYPKCRLKCEPGFHCELESAFCIFPPCEPFQVCIEGEYGPCASALCPPGRCVDIDRRAVCRLPGPPFGI